jgi:hypothetical protein
MDDNVDIPRPPSPLRPPRPFFLAGSNQSSNRSSMASESTSADPSSDSDREPAQIVVRVKNRAHHKKRSSMSTTAFPEASDQESDPPVSSRPPPSSFTFPFQAYPGNPDPGTGIPSSYLRAISSSGLSHTRRSSFSSLNTPRIAHTPLSNVHSRSASSLHSKPVTSVYRNSAAAAMNSPTSSPRGSSFDGPYNSQFRTNPKSLRKSPSQIFRTPFLSPSSRPASIHAGFTPSHPPSSFAPVPTPPNASTIFPPPAPITLPPKPVPKPPLPSARLPLNTPVPKPWLLERPPPRARLSWWLTFLCALLGIVGAAAICWDGIRSVRRLDYNQLCLVMEDNFDSDTIDEGWWSRDIGLGGFGLVHVCSWCCPS